MLYKITNFVYLFSFKHVFIFLLNHGSFIVMDYILFRFLFNFNFYQNITCVYFNNTETNYV